MSTARDDTCMRYTQRAWGDLIEGTKEQLQALGLGSGVAYPGEPGSSTKIEMNVKDPRGYDVRIEKRDDKQFAAFIVWPKRPGSQGEWTPYAPGVEWRKCIWEDEYTGTADALIAAGLIKPHQLPTKYQVTIPGDGGSTGRRYSVGSLIVSRSTPKSSRYVVKITIPEEEGWRRLDAAGEAEAAWVMAVTAMPRPESLIDYIRWFGPHGARHRDVRA